MNELQKQQIRQYQLERIEAIRCWFHEYYIDGLDPMISYIILWAVFNALYNTIDLPNNVIRGAYTEEIPPNPYIKGSGERQKIDALSQKISTDEAFIRTLMERHSFHIHELSTHIPSVTQPNKIRELKFTPDNNDDHEYVFNLNEVRGVASLDNRKFLEDGSVLFQYRRLNLDLDDNHYPRNPCNFLKQLSLVLYQIRNNIVHGGTAAYNMKEKPLLVFALPILEEIVRYLIEQDVGWFLVLE